VCKKYAAHESCHGGRFQRICSQIEFDKNDIGSRVEAAE